MVSESWTVTGPQIIDVENVTAVESTIMRGRIDVVAHDDPRRTDVRVEIHSVEGRPLEIRQDGERLVVGYPEPETGWNWFKEKFLGYTGKDKADVHIAVPATIYARLSTVYADGLIAGINGGVRVGTVSGSVMTSATTGTLRVDSVSGEVIASEHTGDIVMETVSGDLTASGALADIKVTSVSGAVTLDSRTIPTRVEVSSVSADVLLRVPDPNALDYSVHTVSGRILVDGTEFRGAKGAFRRPASNPGAGPLRLSAVSGNVTVLRAGDAPADAVPTPSAAYGTPTSVDPASTASEVQDATGDEAAS